MCPLHSYLSIGTMGTSLNEEAHYMISTYEEYITMPGSLTLEEMQSLHREIKEEVGYDEDALDLYADLIDAVAKYFPYRANWHFWDREKKIAEDSVRTKRHDRVIDCFNILERYLKKKGKSAVWREILGEDRKRIGDFACYLVFAESLNAR